MGNDYDEIDRLIDNDPIELGRLCRRYKAALQACWDEYHELMPDQLHAQVKKALGIREFVAGGKEGGSDDNG